MKNKFNGRLTLAGLCTSKAQRFCDDIVRSHRTTNFTPKWLHRRIKKLLLPGNFVACETCGMEMTFEGITIDHKIPKTKHKLYLKNIHDVDNLELICPTCNSMKGQKTLDEFLKELYERNEYILQLTKQYGRAETIAPIYPKIGFGKLVFGDTSRNYYTELDPKGRKSRTSTIRSGRVRSGQLTR